MAWRSAWDFCPIPYPRVRHCPKVRGWGPVLNRQGRVSHVLLQSRGSPRPEDGRCRELKCGWPGLGTPRTTTPAQVPAARAGAAPVWDGRRRPLVGSPPGSGQDGDGTAGGSRGVMVSVLPQDPARTSAQTWGVGAPRAQPGSPIAGSSPGGQGRRGGQLVCWGPSAELGFLCGSDLHEIFKHN